MKDRFIKIISLCSFVEMVFVIILVYALFNYYIGIQDGSYLFDSTLNIIIIIFLVILLVALWILKIILKRKRRKYLLYFDKS